MTTLSRMRNGNQTGAAALTEEGSKPHCPSCRKCWGVRHEERHAKYIAAHRKAVLAYQHKRKSLGRCVVCGARRGASTTYCEEHLMQQRIHMRQRRGCKPWKAGGCGRLPLDERGEKG
jgi:hypothetical protein